MKRRFFLRLAGGVAAIGAIAYWQRNNLARRLLSGRTNIITSAMAAKAGEDVCVLMPDQTKGPYYFQSAERSAIAEDRPGMPLDLTIEVVRMPDCAPLEGAMVEIWHCDAGGGYSGYGDALARAPFDAMLDIVSNGGPDATLPKTEDTTFLRGGQVSDRSGRVSFSSIFPGWYEPRAPHIHLKVSQGGQSFVITQLYFPDEVSADLYKHHPDYAPHGACPYNLNNDFILGDLADGTGVVLDVERAPDRFVASIRVGIA